MRALGEDLADLGRPRLFRPWNDTRFHPRPPVKEHVGLAVGYEGAGGYYVELSLDGFLVAAGIYQPAPDQLDRLRRAIDDGRTAAPLTRAIARAQRAGLALAEPALVRAPRGYAADHPRLRLLRCKSLTVSRRHALGPWLHRPKAGRTIREELEAATPSGGAAMPRGRGAGSRSGSCSAGGPGAGDRLHSRAAHARARAR